MENYFNYKGRRFETFVGIASPKKETETEKYEEITIDVGPYERSYDLSMGDLFGWVITKDEFRHLKSGCHHKKVYKRLKNSPDYDTWKVNEFQWCCMVYIFKKIEYTIKHCMDFKVKKTIAGIFNNKNAKIENAKVKQFFSENLKLFIEKKEKLEEVNDKIVASNEIWSFQPIIDDIFDTIDKFRYNIENNSFFNKKLLTIQYDQWYYKCFF